MSKEKKSGVALFFWLLSLYAAVFGARYAWDRWLRVVSLATDKPQYFHDDFIEIRLRTRNPRLAADWQTTPPRAVVVRGGQRVKTIAGIEELDLRYAPELEAWTARWPCPWNAPAGEYGIELLGAAPEVLEHLRVTPFSIAYRRPAPLPHGFSVMTLESVTPFSTMQVRAPDGSMKGWRGLLDWVEYVGADAFWILGGQTPGQKPGQVWLEYNFSMLPEIARECKKRGIKFGIYAMCYLTMSDKNKVPGYQYAREVVDGASVPTRAVSLGESKRVEDVTQLLKKFRDIPGVDYVGLDYIRNALGGYELVDEFYAEMPGIRPPPGWEKMGLEERMVYIARKKIMRKDMEFIDAWQWWRAHRVARIVRRIKAGIGDSKPLWAFALTWDKGWHHGQDPVMMNDAGVDADALMLYEATEEQFGALLRDWNRYVKTSDVQLVVGNVVDWPLHQRPPDGPKAFYRRMTQAIDGIYTDGPARGVFIHDLSRALWGRLGDWSTRAWLDEAKAAIKYAKARSASQTRP